MSLPSEVSVGMAYLASLRRYAGDLPEPIIEAFRAYILGNDREKLQEQADALRTALEDPELRDLLEPDTKYVYRFISVGSESELQSILGRKEWFIGSYKKGPAGVLDPKDGGEDGMSSWTANPRSFIYSGFFSTLIPADIAGMLLFRAKVGHSLNTFVGDPEVLYKALELDIGHALEREVVGIGPISYDKVVWGEMREQQSLEGLAADLTERILKLDTLEFNEGYYLPQYHSESQNMEDLYKIAAQKHLASVIQFPDRPLNMGHSVTIAGRKYALSNFPGAHLTALRGELFPEGEGARVIQNEPGWNYLWVFEETHGLLEMWQVHEGNPKVMDRMPHAAQTVAHLKKLGSLNLVSHEELLTLRRAMEKVYDKTLADLEASVEANKTVDEHEVDRMAWEFYDHFVKPKIDEAVKVADSNTPILGFKPVEGGFSVSRQRRSFMISRVFEQNFQSQQIEDYMTQKGFDHNQETIDIQALEWARQDVIQKVSTGILRGA